MLVIVLGVVLAITYGEIVRSSRSAAVERLQRVTRELATSAERSVELHARIVHDTLGADSVFRQALAGATPDSALLEGKLRRSRAIGDSDSVIELWAADGRRVWKGGTDAGVGTASEVGGGPPMHGDSTHYGPLYAEHGRVYYWIVSPIVHAGHRLGWLVERRRIRTTAQAQHQIAGLIGPNVAVYFRNDTGSFWSTLAGSPVSPPTGYHTVGGFETRVRTDQPTVGRVFVAESRIAGTPWTLALEVPVNAVLAGPRASIARLAVFTLVLLLVAVILAWTISRRLTRPLLELTETAEWIARGDYSRRIDESHAASGDEIGRLAASFNRMAEEVAASHSELEQQMEEAQALSEELESANAQLQDTTLEAELSRDEAEMARRQAEEANRAKSSFLATMSHELRTPLNAIAGYAELLEMGVRGPITGEQREDLERIRRSQRSLLALVDDVLSFARIEAGKVEYHIAEVSLDATLAAMETHIAPQARAKGIVYEYRPAGAQARLWADREKLERIVLNLLSNAVKFTESGGAVVLESEVRAHEVLIRVADTGSGIAQDKLESIFEPFTQAEAGLTRRSEGSGLGLAISREFAHAMGGDLTVESTVRQGSRFTLRLPVRPPAQEDGASVHTLGDGVRVDEARA